MDYSIIFIDGNRNGKETCLCVKQYCVVRTPTSDGDSSAATTSQGAHEKSTTAIHFTRFRMLFVHTGRIIGRKK